MRLISKSFRFGAYGAFDKKIQRQTATCNG